MNKVVLMGRLTKDPNVRYSQGESQTCVARFTLAVDRRWTKSQDGQTADFISCVAFGKTGEFAEKYAHKGTKFVVSGRIQTGSYQNKEGQTVYTTDVVVEDMEFAESKNAASSNGGGYSAPGGAPADSSAAPQPADDGFMNVPDEIDDELPFN